jgi:uncharacterized protein YbjT (DUF2867 family)
MNILLTGATGFVGSNLLPKLLEQGHQVTLLTRNPSTIKIFHENISIVQGDILNAQDCLKALENIDLAFYLIHGLNESDHFEYKESLAALNFVKAANKHKLKKIIYLSALTSSREDEVLSPHMRSRQLVGEILRLSNCEVIELRASIILGAGSTSFEMIKALNERLPFLIESKLLKSPCQPLALEDLLTILLICIDRSMGTKIVEIGGKEITTYQNLIALYAQIKGLNRKTIPIKFISKDVIAQFIDMVLPEYSTVGKKLFESIEHETTVNNDTDLKEILPNTHSLHEAMTTAISNSQTHYDPIWDKEFYNMILNEKVLPEIYDHLGNLNAQELFKLVKNSTKLLRATKLF